MNCIGIDKDEADRISVEVRKFISDFNCTEVELIRKIHLYVHGRSNIVFDTYGGLNLPTQAEGHIEKLYPKYLEVNITIVGRRN